MPQEKDKNAAQTPGKRKITVEGMSVTNNGYEARIVLWEDQEVEGQILSVPLGEAGVSFEKGKKPADMLPAIKAKAAEIESKIDEAKNVRNQVNQLLELEP